MLIFNGCKKEVNKLGFGVQPESDKIDVLYNDTSSVVAYSTLLDSISSSNAPTSLAGSLLDPVFGTTTASFSVSFRLSRTSFSFGDNPQMDSLIFTLEYEKLFGDTLSEVTLRFYELTEALQSDTVYYSNSHVEWSEVLLSEISFVPNIRDSVVVDGDTLPPHMRVNMNQLSTALGDKLIGASDDEMSSNSSFQELFKGLRVEAVPVNSSGQIIAFNMLASMSEMRMYYSNDESDSLLYIYSINNNSVRFGNFLHDYSLGDNQFRSQVIEGDTTLGSEVVYVQPMGGVMTKIFFPHISSWYNDGPVAVNEARLFLEGYEEMPYLDPPALLILTRLDEDGNLIPLLEQLEGVGYFGGQYDEENDRYWFRITNYVQQLMSGTIESHGLALIISGAAYTTDRILISGYDPGLLPEKKMRLELTYTPL